MSRCREALGNDQNCKEMIRDQHGVRELRFRYALAAHSGPYRGAEAFAWSRSMRTGLLERNREELPIANGKVTLELRAHGLAAVRLLP